MRFYPFAFTGKERDEETGYGYIGPLGGRYENYYKYDPLHRLTRAGGSNQYRFEQAFELSRAGRPLSMSTNGMVKHYAYGEHTPPHAPQRIMVERHTLHDLRWDPAGNLGQVSTLAHDRGDIQSRFLFWTEDNRLHTVVDDRHHSYYAYDHTGERTMKVTGHSHQLDVNADLMHTAAGLDEFTLYPSPYLVFTNRGYTKHYYAGTERLAARIGGGFDRPVVGGDHGLSQLATALFEQCQKETEKRVLEAIPPHTIRRDHLSENIYMAMMREFEIPMHLMANAVIKSNNLISTAQNVVAGNAEPNVYFYHSDHLGSASWITDGDGIPVQHLQYLPYGEPFVNQRAAGYSERFTFTGKERDVETGYGYFGARYMDHELMTMWLSVDPMADKYPSLSPYNYCMWNPIKLVDPDGREVSTHTDEWGKVIAVFEDGDNGVYMHKGDAHARVNKHYSPENTSAGGRYMGESLHSLSFADQGKYNKDGIVEPMKDMVIDYGSLELTMMANMIMDQEPSLLQYGRNAGTGGDWDIKAHVSHGSKLYGKYASPRDAGNFVAGMVAVSNGRAMENVAQFGYGAYNLSGNDKVKTFGIVAATLLLRATNPIIGIPLVDCVMNGEDKLSQRCIDLGKVYQKEKMNKR